MHLCWLLHCRLAEKPIMQLVSIHRDEDNKDAVELRALTDITANKFVECMAGDMMELCQSLNRIPGILIIVRNTMTANPGVYTAILGTLGCCRSRWRRVFWMEVFWSKWTPTSWSSIEPSWNCLMSSKTWFCNTEKGLFLGKGIVPVKVLLICCSSWVRLCILS